MEILDVMLTSPNAVKAVSYVTNNVSDEMIGASIREAQDIHLQSITGSELLYKLQELVYNSIEGYTDAIEDPENHAYKELLDVYVEPYMISKAQFLLCAPNSYKSRNMGVVTNSDTNVNDAGMENVGKIMARYNTEAARRATALSMYLCANKAEFPELTQSACGCRAYVQPMIGRRFINVPINLGRHTNKCC